MTMPFLVDLATSGFILFAVITREPENQSLRRRSREPSRVGWCEVEATNSRTHFKEYPEVFQNS